MFCGRHSPSQIRVCCVAVLVILMLVLFSGCADGDSSGGDGVALEVPDVVGATSEYARGVLETSGFVADVMEVPGGGAVAGEVFEQVPAAGTEAEVGSTVIVKIAAEESPPTTEVTTTTSALPGSIEFGVSLLLSAPPPVLPQTNPDYGLEWPANGSGCVPGGDDLPDGVWFGFVEDVIEGAGSQGGDRLVFDMGCFYSGVAAHEEAWFDGVYPYEEIYARNQVAKTFDASVISETVVYRLDTYGDHVVSTLDDWFEGFGASRRCPGSECAVWLYINSGIVTEIVEQVLP
jgi:hypothetical protein